MNTGPVSQATDLESPYAGTGGARMALLSIAPDRTAAKGTIAFHMWRGQALTAAAARREIWLKHHQHSTKWLRTELAMHRFHLTPYCEPYRSDNLNRVSLWYVRLIVTELRNRGASASLTRSGAQS